MRVAIAFSSLHSTIFAWLANMTTDDSAHLHSVSSRLED